MQDAQQERRPEEVEQGGRWPLTGLIDVRSRAATGLVTLIVTIMPPDGMLRCQLADIFDAWSAVTLATV